jgi:hypothetical protein
MGLSTNGRRITPYRGSWADQEFKRRNASLMLSDPNSVDDAIAVANIREQVRLFGIDRVRGL